MINEFHRKSTTLLISVNEINGILRNLVSSASNLRRILNPHEEVPNDENTDVGVTVQSTSDRTAVILQQSRQLYVTNTTTEWLQQREIQQNQVVQNEF